MVIVPLSKKSKRMAGNSLGGTGHMRVKRITTMKSNILLVINDVNAILAVEAYISTVGRRDTLVLFYS